MSTFGCSHCAHAHGRSTMLSFKGCYYFESDIPTNYGGLFGCPKCTYVVCALCAEELDSICTCGGELVHDVKYRYDPIALPKSIRRLRTTDERRNALDALRIETKMILAEYNDHLYTINEAEESRAEGEPPPPNIGASLMKKYARIYTKGIITAQEVASRIWDYAVEENVDEILSYLDEPVRRILDESCKSYPTTTQEWDEYVAKCVPAEYYVPQRDPVIRMNEFRDVVTCIRDGLSRLDRIADAD